MLRYKNPIWRGIVRLRRWIGCYPGLYYPLARWVKPRTFPWVFASSKSELVVDAYPGSGNTFCFIAFESAQKRPTTMAHHVHVPAQILRGLQLNLPTVMLIRDPDEAISSNLARWSHLTMHEALLDYIGFYKPLWEYRNDFLSVHFDDVVGDFGAVIERINRRFGTSFHPFEHTDENVAVCWGRMKKMEVSNWDRNVPHEERNREKAKLVEALKRPPYACLREECCAWYAKYLPFTMEEAG